MNPGTLTRGLSSAVDFSLFKEGCQSFAQRTWQYVHLSTAPKESFLLYCY